MYSSDAQANSSRSHATEIFHTITRTHTHLQVPLEAAHLITLLNAARSWLHLSCFAVTACNATHGRWRRAPRMLVISCGYVLGCCLDGHSIRNVPNLKCQAW